MSAARAGSAGTGSSSALGVVLAGGRGSRLGGAKATVPLAGRPLVVWALDAVRAVAASVAVVAKADTELPPLEDVDVWREPQGHFHPVHGLLHALRHAGDRTVVVVPVDMPLVAPQLLAELRDAVGAGVPAAVAQAAGRLQPLCGAFAPAAVAPLAAAAPDAPLKRTVRDMGAAVVQAGAHAASLVNVNTPADRARVDRKSVV